MRASTSRQGESPWQVTIAANSSTPGSTTAVSVCNRDACNSTLTGTNNWMFNCIESRLKQST